MLSDRELVAQCKQGRQEAFRTLVDRHWSTVVGAVSAILRDPDDVEDVAQETFIQACRHLRDLKDPDKLPAWLNSVARNAARKSLRQRRLARDRLPEYELKCDLLDFDPPAVLEYRELRAQINRLPAPDRAAVNLFYLAGLEVDRIAKLLCVPPGTVKSRLHRARNRLRERMVEMAKSSTDRTVPSDAPTREVIAGMRGTITWDGILIDDSLSAWRPPADKSRDDLEKTWRVDGNAIVGDSREFGENAPVLIAGDPTWADYELSLLITPISGGNAQVRFRLSEDERSWYLLDFLLGWQAVAISRVMEGRLTKLSVVNYPTEKGQEYEVQIAAREASLTSYVDGKLVNQVADESIRSGSFALLVWGSCTAYRDVRYRHLH